MLIGKRVNFDVVLRMFDIEFQGECHHSPGTNQRKKELTMSTEENKTVARRLVEEVINTGKLEDAAQYFIPNYVDHATPPGIPPGLDGFKAFFAAFRAAFPDLHYTIEDNIAEGDRVVQRATASGTMKGDFLGMPATGKNATWAEIHIVRVKDGKIVEHWASVDQLGMLQQLGLVPVPAQGS